MEKRIKLLTVIVVLIALCTLRPASRVVAAAVVPSDPGRELYESLRYSTRNNVPASTKKAVASFTQDVSVLIEGHKKVRSKKVFSAAQFVCRLPIETGTYTTLCKEPKDAEAAMKKMKEQGFDEIWLKTPASGEVYDAIVRSARELEIRINV